MAATEPPPLPDVLIPSLPNDVALNILARVPRQYHPVLSAVSKSIRFVISSPQLLTARSLLKCTEDLLYFKLHSLSLGTETWFAVYRLPNSIVTPEDGPKSLLRFAGLPPNPLPLLGSTYAVVGPKIYVIGGANARDVNFVSPSSDVWILDCRFHTWERGPSVRTPRLNASAAVVEGKVYVIGGWTKESWVEVFDPVDQSWEPVPSPLDGRNDRYLDVDVVDGRIYVSVGKQEFRFDPETKAWEVFGYPYVPSEECVVDGVFFSYDIRGRIKGYDERNRVWRELKGVMLPKYVCGFKVVSLKGRLVMVWGEVRCGNLENGVLGLWIAEIEVRKNGDDGDWWGEVVKVLLVGESNCGLTEEYFYESVFSFDSKCLSVTL